MNHEHWWDIAGLVGIGLICALVIVRRLRNTFAASSGAGCPGCSKGCGSDGTVKSGKL